MKKDVLYISFNVIRIIRIMSYLSKAIPCMHKNGRNSLNNALEFAFYVTVVVT